MVVAVNWQDADSSSAKSFRYVFPDSSLAVLCFVEAMSVVHMPTISKTTNQKSLWIDHLFPFMLKTIHNWHQLSVNVLVKGHIPKNAVVRQTNF